MKAIIDFSPTLDSTNDEAKRRLKNLEDVPEGTVIWAAEQTRGRGRHGRRWHSQLGNLYCSLILKPSKSLLEIAQLSLMMAVCVGETLSKWIPDSESITYKWPNDVLIHGQKISGILLETEFSPGSYDNPTVILGVGINLKTCPDFVVYPTTCLSLLTEDTPDIREVLDHLLEKIFFYYELWHQKGFEEIRPLWLKRAHGIGKLMTVVIEHQPRSVFFDSINHQGAFVCTDSKGQEYTLSSSEIFFGME